MRLFIDVYKPEYFTLVSDFQCNDNGSVLNQYLMYNAQIDNKKGLGTTHLLLSEDDTPDSKRIVGFFVLRNALLIKRESDMLEGDPAIEITQFAVHKDMEGKEYGKWMIQYIIALTLKINEQFSGVKYIVLSSVDSAIGFYKKMNFKELNQFEKLPKEQWSKDCTSMYFKLL